MRSTRSPSWISRLLGTGPMLLPPHVFGVRERGLAYLAVERERDRLSVAELIEIDLPEDAFAEGPLGGPPRDPSAFEAEVASLVRGARDGSERASLVLPDRWLRLVFAEITDLPRAPVAREDALRFKLRNLVPFRPEELRLRATEVAPLPDQAEPRRLALAFAPDLVVTHIETAFAHSGVRIGSLTNESLAMASAIAADGLVLLALGRHDSYTLLVLRNGEPLLFRFKELSASLPLAAREPTVRRELLLTRSFLEERLGGCELDQAFVVAEDGPQWGQWIADALGTDCRLIGPEILGFELASLPSAWTWWHDGPLLGAALQEVA